ncbi:O-antigen ligase family protein [Radiobacillus sp. PE A8.2]|uniref:O-antigen ligase family protein n=1 Tax=Radiobacillus sp. PE A8.2 TaxID=3380349 RepID=UPI00388EEB60
MNKIYIPYDYNNTPKKYHEGFRGSKFIYALMIFMSIYPSVGINSYIPYYLLGISVGFILLNKVNISIPMIYVVFIVWVIFINILQLPLNNLSLMYGIKTSIGIIFPLLAYILGQYYSKKVRGESIEKVLFVLLIIQFIVVFMQMAGTSFGLKTYTVFAGDKGIEYLQYISYGNRYQAIGTIGNPNELGVFSLLLSAFLLFFSSIKKPLVIISLILTSYIVLCSQSRTSVILFCVLIFARIIYTERISLGKKIFRTLLGILSTILLLYYAANNLGRELSFDQLNTRYILWDHAWEKVYSFNDLINLYIMIVGRGISYVKITGSVDNSYMNIMFSSGIIGLSSFIALIIILFFLAKRIVVKRYKFIVYSYLIIYAISCTVMDVYFIMKVSFLLFFIIGYLLNSNEQHLSTKFTVEKV